MENRECVYKILIKVIKDGEFLNATVKAELDLLGKAGDFSVDNRNFITFLATGVIEKRTELDYIIEHFTGKTVNKLKKEIYVILLMGIFQLKYMYSVPSHAAINESVKLAVKHGFYKLKGFVNGVLRNVDRAIVSGEEFLPDASETAKYLSVKYAIPRWIVEHLQKAYGDMDVEKIVAGFRQREEFTGTTIRVNTALISVEGLKEKLEKKGVKCLGLSESLNGMETDEKFPVKEPDEIFPVEQLRSEVLFIDNFANLEKLPGFEEGEFYVQDISAIEPVAVAGITPGMTVVDVCASPGGKSIHAANLMGNNGVVISRDVSEKKIAKIEENAKRLKTDCLKAEVFDATVLDEEMIDKADVVIADLPCSGIGVIAKKPDIRHRIKLEDLTELKEIQACILEVVKSYVKPGGKMIFSTCTLNPGENDDNLKTFLSENKNFSYVKGRTIFPDGIHDGFYYAILEKK